MLPVMLVLLGGCASASTTSDGWTKPGMTQEQLGRDRTECLTEARQVTPSIDGPRMKLNYPRYEKCMADRGYTSASVK
jgi:hypothetical protein